VLHSSEGRECNLARYADQQCPRRFEDAISDGVQAQCHRPQEEADEQVVRPPADEAEDVRADDIDAEREELAKVKGTDLPSRPPRAQSPEGHD
jgi:hypothetical protein